LAVGLGVKKARAKDDRQISAIDISIGHLGERVGDHSRAKGNT